MPGTPKQVVELVGAAGVAGQLPLHLLHGVGIEQVAQFLLAEQLAQQVAVEGQRLGRRSAGGVSSSYMYVAM